MSALSTTQSFAPMPREAQHITFKGLNVELEGANLLAFWKWAFSDLCDDDIKGIFAEWMVGMLLGLPLSSGRRVSWANSDIILPNGKRIEVKASALWQSYKLVNEDGSRKSCPQSRVLDPKKIRFGTLQSRNSVTVPCATDPVNFKSDFYVFCFQNQTDPAKWDAWDLSQWEFYVVSRQELFAHKVGRSISLLALQTITSARTASALREYFNRFPFTRA